MNIIPFLCYFPYFSRLPLLLLVSSRPARSPFFPRSLHARAQTQQRIFRKSNKIILPECRMRICLVLSNIKRRTKEHIHMVSVERERVPCPALPMLNIFLCLCALMHSVRGRIGGGTLATLRVNVGEEGLEMEKEEGQQKVEGKR